MKKLQENSAIKIQRCYRGYIGRKEVKIIKQERKIEIEQERYLRERKAEKERVLWEAQLNEEVY